MENTTTPNSTLKPNIIFITVDQMRFPMHLPPDTTSPLTPDQFVEKHMPNLWKFLWQPGIRFSNYYTAASDCTASRATIYTGLYAYQTYSMLTLTNFPDLDNFMPPYTPEPGQVLQPELDPVFPTIGKLMLKAGYDTPYFGKWHLSYHVADLERYGFDSHIPAGDYPGKQGQGFQSDETIARDAAEWIRNRFDPKNPPNSKPFFFAVNFVNPHDKQFFWGGMETEKFKAVYKQIPETPAQEFNEVVGEAEPTPVYSEDIQLAIPNWEDDDHLSLTKPRTQTLLKEVFQYQMGGIWERDKADTYTGVKDPANFAYAVTKVRPGGTMHKAIAPPHYWTKALDSYVQVMHYVDDAIGTFMNSIPEEVRQNSIFVLTSDHGEYGSSHGLQGKGGSVYEEGIRVPLIVYDPSGHYTKSVDHERSQLCSSVDLLRMFVSMGHGGTTDWMRDEYQQLYGSRCDLLGILEKADAPGRNYALHSTDEFIPEPYNYLNAPLHVVGQIKMDANRNKQKLGVYTRWEKHVDEDSQARVVYPESETENVEFYDLKSDANEMVSTPKVQAAKDALATLFGGSEDGLLHSELQAELPTEELRLAQTKAYHALLEYERLVTENAIKEESNTVALARAWAF